MVNLGLWLLAGVFIGTVGNHLTHGRAGVGWNILAGVIGAVVLGSLAMLELDIGDNPISVMGLGGAVVGAAFFVFLNNLMSHSES